MPPLNNVSDDDDDLPLSALIKKRKLEKDNSSSTTTTSTTTSTTVIKSDSDDDLPLSFLASKVRKEQTTNVKKSEKNINFLRKLEKNRKNKSQHKSAKLAGIFSFIENDQFYIRKEAIENKMNLSFIDEDSESEVTVKLGFTICKSDDYLIIPGSPSIDVYRRNDTETVRLRNKTNNKSRNKLKFALRT